MTIFSVFLLLISLASSQTILTNLSASSGEQLDFQCINTDPTSDSITISMIEYFWGGIAELYVKFGSDPTTCSLYKLLYLIKLVQALMIVNNPDGVTVMKYVHSTPHHLEHIILC